jgi:hypothetical protein
MALPTITDTRVELSLQTFKRAIEGITALSGFNVGIDNWHDYDPDGVITLTTAAIEYNQPNHLNECYYQLQVWVRRQYPNDDIWPWLRKACWEILFVLCGKVWGNPIVPNEPVTCYVDQGVETDTTVRVELREEPYADPDRAGGVLFEHCGVLYCNVFIPGQQIN